MRSISNRFETNTIEAHDGFWVDIVYDKKEQMLESYLWHEGYGIKNFMYGEPVYQPNGSNDGKTFKEIYERFCELVFWEDDLDFEMSYYEEKYMDESEEE